jgi:hypothetical protein
MLDHFVADPVFAWGFLDLESGDRIIEFCHGKIRAHRWRGVGLLLGLELELGFNLFSSCWGDFDSALGLKDVGKEVCCSFPSVVFLAHQNLTSIGYITN